MGLPPHDYGKFHKIHDFGRSADGGPSFFFLSFIPDIGISVESRIFWLLGVSRTNCDKQSYRSLQIVVFGCFWAPNRFLVTS